MSVASQECDDVRGCAGLAHSLGDSDCMKFVASVLKEAQQYGVEKSAFRDDFNGYVAF